MFKLSNTHWCVARREWFKLKLGLFAKIFPSGNRIEKNYFLVLKVLIKINKIQTHTLSAVQGG